MKSHILQHKASSTMLLPTWFNSSVVQCRLPPIPWPPGPPSHLSPWYKCSSNQHSLFAKLFSRLRPGLPICLPYAKTARLPGTTTPPTLGHQHRPTNLSIQINVTVTAGSAREDPNQCRSCIWSVLQHNSSFLCLCTGWMQQAPSNHLQNLRFHFLYLWQLNVTAHCSTFSAACWLFVEHVAVNFTSQWNDMFKKNDKFNQTSSNQK